MTTPRVMTLDDALVVRAHTAAAIQTELVDGPAGGWRWSDGALAHELTDFFRIIGRRVDGDDHIMVRQSEHALVGLLVCGPRDARRLLLNARAEPGLHGLCQFSTTVQSTPSNYERRHGGSATPHLEHFLSPAPGSVLHDSLQYDWGDYYHRKSKRVLIVEVPDLVATAEPNLWVDEGLARELARMPHMVTSDLRVALLTLDALDRHGVAIGSDAQSGELTSPAEQQNPPVAHDVSLRESTAWSVHTHGITGDRVDVVWARTSTTTREVAEWVQPLLSPRSPLELELAVREGKQGLEAAVEWRSAVGLDGTLVVYPAHTRHATVLADERSSAEGGRFWNHAVAMRIVEATTESATWLPLATLTALALQPLRTSLELRLLLEVARALEDAAP